MLIQNNENPFRIFYAPDLESGGTVADDSQDLGFDGPPDDYSDEFLDGPPESISDGGDSMFDFEPTEEGEDIDVTHDTSGEYDSFLPDEGDDDDIDSEFPDDEPDSVEDKGDDENAADTEGEADINEVADGVPIGLVLRAGQLGVSQDDVNFYSDLGAEALGRYLDTVENMRGPGKEAEGEEGEKSAANNAPVDGDPFAVKEYEFGLGDDEDSYEPVLVDSLKGMANHYNSEISRVMENIKALGSEVLYRMQESVAIESNALIDSRSADKSVDYKKAFGAGNMDRATSDQLAMRDQVTQTIVELQEQRRVANKPQLPVSQYFDQAVAKMFPDQVSAQTNKNQRLARRSKSTVAKSSGKVNRSAQKRFGKQAAKEALKAQYGDEFTD